MSVGWCCLISAATVDQFSDKNALDRDSMQRVPLGALCLAATLQEHEITPVVVNLDMLYAEWLNRDCAVSDRQLYVEYVADHLARLAGTIFGFSSICSSYPLTLRIISALRQRRPEACIILGGPQATATAVATLHGFPAVDVVVRGEGESVLPTLLSSIVAGADLRSVAGITFRSGSNIVQNVEADLLTDLDSLPLPAYHLLPNVKSLDYLPIEIGRGCPFRCTFCSTSQFFRHRFRLKSPKTAVAQMAQLKVTYGLCRFELVHDNFTASRRQAAAFCEELLSLSLGVQWSCSARTDCLDDELIDLMWKAGCRGVFLGVESGSGKIQKCIRKNLNIDEAKKRLRRLNRRKIETAVAFITGFPEETWDDVRDTAHFYLDVMRFDYIEPQITLLSPLAGTPIYKRHKDELIFDDVISDMSFQGVEQDLREREMISSHREVFSSFFSVPTRFVDRQDLNELRYLLINATFDLRWLLIAIRQAIGDFLDVFPEWQQWRRNFGNAEAQQRLQTYYAGPVFRAEFRTYVREVLTRRLPAVAHVFESLAVYQKSYESRTVDTATGQTPRNPSRVPLPGRSRPQLAPGLTVATIEADYSQILACLRHGGRLSRIVKRSSTVLTRGDGRRVKTLQLSPLSAELVALCDGEHTLQEIVRAFGRRRPKIFGIDSDKACLIGLRLLQKQGILKIALPST